MNATSQARNAISLFRYAAPAEFYRLAGKAVPVFGTVAAVLAAIGLYLGFFVAPTDAQQGESYRILFIHVPVAWMGMLIYVVMAFWAAVGLIFNTRMSSIMASALAPTGALMAFLTLWTGSMWGRPAWGTYWDWDARMTSSLILLFLYMGFMALHSAIEDPRRADRASAVLALVGVVNVPIIYFSVQWWNSLHQGSSIRVGSAPTIAPMMLAPMLVLTFAVWSYCIAAALARARAIVLERERGTDWVRALAARWAGAQP
jgi:heme exporter protein C